MTTTTRTVAHFVPDDVHEGPARELLRRLTAPARHADRTAATLAVAEAHASPLAGALALCADLVGSGGPLGLGGPGGATARVAPFCQLGKGRWQASDGGAWRAAAWDAFAALTRGQGRSLLLTVAADGTPVAQWREADDGAPSTEAVPLAAVLAAPWLRALVGRCLAVASGCGEHLYPLEDGSPLPDGNTHVGGAPDAWAIAFDHLISPDA